MKLKIYQIDAFSDEVFKGNPAAVCPLQEWLPDQVMQSIAMENNLSETAFFVGASGSYALRWFTPVAEVDLCGHATLASGWVLYNEMGDTSLPLRFMTKSGELRLRGSGNTFTMDFPLQPAKTCTAPSVLVEGLGVEPVEVLLAADFLVRVEDEDTVLGLKPDFGKLQKLPHRGVIVTAPGKDVDFVSRWFGPNVGVDEDPVTGSAHTTLAPYWADKLNKKEMAARQVSARGGNLRCRVDKDRVFITGTAAKYMEGEIYI